jgi:hypothetical protein
MDKVDFVIENKKNIIEAEINLHNSYKEKAEAATPVGPEDNVNGDDLPF